MTRRNILHLLIAAFAIPQVGASGQAQDGLTFVNAREGFTVVTPRTSTTFSPRFFTDGYSTLFRFVGESDHASTTLEVDNQGLREGGSRTGYAQLSARAQDEIHDAAGRVLSSSDFRGGLRVHANSFGWTTDPRIGHCVDIWHCPNTTEIFSDGAVSVVASNAAPVYLVVGNRIALLVERNTAANRDLVPTAVKLPDLKAPAGTRRAVCVDDSGTLGFC